MSQVHSVTHVPVHSRFSVDRRLIGKDKHGTKLSGYVDTRQRFYSSQFVVETFLNIIFQASLAMIWVSFEFEWGSRRYCRYLYCKRAFAAGACQVLESVRK